MSKINDNKILELKGKILEKRNKIEEMNKRFIPITNCILVLDDVKYNLNVAKREELVILAIKINSLIQSAKELSFINFAEVELSGFKLTQWLDDIKSKIETINYKEEKQKLELMESRLDELLSNEKKVELEIGEIESSLNF